jgi:hypothetical protein
MRAAMVTEEGFLPERPMLWAYEKTFRELTSSGVFPNASKNWNSVRV